MDNFPNFLQWNSSDIDDKLQWFVFEIQSGMNEFDDRIFALLNSRLVTLLRCCQYDKNLMLDTKRWIYVTKYMGFLDFSVLAS